MGNSRSSVRRQVEQLTLKTYDQRYEMRSKISTVTDSSYLRIVSGSSGGGEGQRGSEDHK